MPETDAPLEPTAVALDFRHFPMTGPSRAQPRAARVRRLDPRARRWQNRPMAARLGAVATSFFGPDPWPPLLARLRAKVRQVDAAIAFVTDDVLGLRRGDRLVVDASDARLRTGATNPSVLAAMLARGVELWSCAGLHAKVVLVDSQWLMVGSANASKMSRKLHEAAVVTGSRSAIAGAKQMIEQFRSAADVIDSRFIARARRVYRPPTGSPAPSARRLRGSVYWLVPSTAALDDNNHEADAAARQVEHLVRRRGSYATWTENSDSILRKVDAGDSVVFAYWEGRRMLLEPQRVLAVQRLPDGTARLLTEERSDYEDRGIPWGAGKRLLENLGEHGLTQSASRRLHKRTGERLADWLRESRPYRR